MPEIGLHITSSGASEGKAALDGLKEGMEGIVQEHNKMAEKFGNKVEHLGLKLFAGEALRAAGAGKETNEVLRLMSFSMNTLQTSAAALALPITVLVGVLAGAVAIFMQMKKAAEEKQKALEDLSKATREQLRATDDTLKTINEFIATVKNVPPELMKWKDAEEELRKVQIQRMIDGDRAIVRSTTEVMNASRQRMATLKDEISDLQKQIGSLQSSGVDQVTINAQQARLETLRREYQKLGDEQIANKAKLEGLFVEIKRLTDGQTQSLKEQADAYKEAQEEADKAYSKMISDSEKLAAEETARYQSWAKLHAETLEKNQKLNKEYNEEFDKVGRGAVRSVGQAFGDSFVQMAFHGKNFTESMINAFHRMTEQIIADIIRIKIEYAILGAMGGPGGAAGGGFLRMFSRASGGSDLVTKPTLFLAGEGGEPEVATFTPMSKMGGGGASIGAPQGMRGGGTTIVVEKIETHAHGVQNPSMFADEVGRAIINRIRGMGELNFIGG